MFLWVVVTKGARFDQLDWPRTLRSQVSIYNIELWNLEKKIEKEMVIVLLRHFKQTQDFTSFLRQAIIAHQSKLNSYFRALKWL